MSWQKLWSILEGSGAGPTFHPEAARKPGPLTERYRPGGLCEIVGQPNAVAFLSAIAANPYPVALLFEGETGTGKTSAALALAAELGCDVEQEEFGGVYTVASGEQTADAVREVCRLMWNSPMYGSGWKVVTVNEVDRISRPAETIWLDRLEALPPRTVVVFTTNHPELLSSRFRDRCIRLEFESNAEILRKSAFDLSERIWRCECGRAPRAAERTKIIGVVHRATEDELLSFRRVVQGLAPLLAVALAERQVTL